MQSSDGHSSASFVGAFIRSSTICAVALCYCIGPVRGVDLVERTVLIPQAADETIEIVNPMRSFHTWFGSNNVPNEGIAQDRYERFSWADLEPVENKFDLSLIENRLRALPKGVKFAFRVLALNSYETRRTGSSVPEYVVNECPKGFSIPISPRSPSGPSRLYVPDWNCPYFLSRIDALLARLGQFYDGDPRIAWIEIGLYGNYGEWHLYGIPGSAPFGAIPYSNAGINALGALPGTVESRKRIVDAHVRAFPRTQLLMMTDDTQMLLYALRLQTSIPIGLRRDSFGSGHFERDFVNYGTSPTDLEFIRRRWRTAPFMVETNGIGGIDVPTELLGDKVLDWHISGIGDNLIGWNGLPQFQKSNLLKAGRLSGYRYEIVRVEVEQRQRSLSFRSVWRNSGSAPTYENWKVWLRLCNDSGKACFDWASSAVDLKLIMPGPEGVSIEDTIDFPSNIPGGLYTLSILVSDPASHRVPMRLALHHRLSDGGYEIGTIRLN